MEGTTFVELLIVHPHLKNVFVFFYCCFIFISLVEDIAGVQWGDVLGQSCCSIVREGGSERSGPPMNFTRGQQSTRERPEHKLPDSTTIMNDMFEILTLQTVYKFEMSKSKQNKRFCRRSADNQFFGVFSLAKHGKCIFAFYCLQPRTAWAPGALRTGSRRRPYIQEGQAHGEHLGTGTPGGAELLDHCLLPVGQGGLQKPS